MSEGSPEIKEADPNMKNGVLLSDQIKRYVDEFKLIDPFYEKNLQAASYDFTIGDKYKKEGQEYQLDKEHPNLVIQPHEAVVVCTKEKLNMPRFLVGRWNLRVSLVYQGLVWVGGVHVDPGWHEELWCPLYNLSKQQVVLHPGDTFASIDFETTTPFNSGKSKLYEKQRKEPNHPGSGLEELRDKVVQFPKNLEEYRANVSSRLEQYQGTNFFIMAIIVAAVSVIAVLPSVAGGVKVSDPQVGLIFLTLFISVFALVLSSLSLIAYGRNRIRE